MKNISITNFSIATYKIPDIMFQVTFHESGFSYDDYPIELAWTLRTTSTAGGAVSRTSGTDKRPR